MKKLFDKYREMFLVLHRDDRALHCAGDYFPLSAKGLRRLLLNDILNNMHKLSHNKMMIVIHNHRISALD